MDKDVSKIQEIFYELRVEEVMTRDVITVTPQTSMREVQDILREHCISGTPVLEDGRLIGIVSLMDLIQTLEAMEIDGLVADHMTYNVETLCGDERVVSAIARFQQTGLWAVSGRGPWQREADWDLDPGRHRQGHPLTARYRLPPARGGLPPRAALLPGHPL